MNKKHKQIENKTRTECAQLFDNMKLKCFTFTARIFPRKQWSQKIQIASHLIAQRQASWQLLTNESWRGRLVAVLPSGHFKIPLDSTSETVKYGHLSARYDVSKGKKHEWIWCYSPIYYQINEFKRERTTLKTSKAKKNTKIHSGSQVLLITQ